MRGDTPTDVLRRGVIIAFIAFFTLADLFGGQALLPVLVDRYGVDAGTMGVAVNASTIGMAVAGLTVAWFSDRIDRVLGTWLSLALLSVPTMALAFAPDTATFFALRVLQGVFMASAFTLTMTYLSERCDKTAAAGAMAAYITGNVASNFLGRLLAVNLTDWVGLEVQFLVFACLNLMGAFVAYRYLGSSLPLERGHSSPSFAVWLEHLSHAPLRAAFLVGFMLLFVFIGTFTYVNLELVGPRFGLSPQQLGLVYLVFIPALLTTPFAGHLSQTIGARSVFIGASGFALLGLVMTLSQSIEIVLMGLVLISIGTFFAQAVATGYVGRTAKVNQAAANGLYLASYYAGGIAGAAALGQVFLVFGWIGCVVGLILAVVLAALLSFSMTEAAE